MNQRLISLLLVVALVCGGSLPVFAQKKIEDISQDHWAYQSVVKLINQGYLSLYDGNKFKGEEAVTRYQLAKVLNKIIQNVEQKQVSLQKKDILTLKKLATEFRSELVSVMSKTNKLEKKVDSLSDQQTILKEDIIKTNHKISNLRQELLSLINDLREEALTKLRTRITKLEKSNQQLEKKLQQLEIKVASKGGAAEVKTLKRRFYWLGAGLSIGLLLLINR
ncbi:putative S-layer protein [Halobacteroides halobius DSM 5150]|uniref:Putative S-layer protein n=1 Tax=Halobacteroides halobius (strain ATCC 35273 / DSM 5150 / MD-1) TaxID=748449 RepID=L0K6Q5_HALHC|nr:S-layer homology domain-containing protein [Halobacteroides halobius]AGB40947.1 putative S-layer protein [Halobacteroides halobius DSM 5150]